MKQSNKLRILLLSTGDTGGGAEKVAFDLSRAYRRFGHDARLLVRYKRTRQEHVLEADVYAHTSPWAPICASLEKLIRCRSKFPGQYRLVDFLRRVAWPQRWRDYYVGFEDFNYPYSYSLLSWNGWVPDVIHAHNLHGDYFDLRALASLSKQVPVVWTLHDTWAITGHCGYFIDCEKWRYGCGACPDLHRQPAIQRDRTAENLAQKAKIYGAGRIAVATPSYWLMRCVEQSVLTPWYQQTIPYGVDLSIFKPNNQREARLALHLPEDRFICVFIAFSGNKMSPYKDYGVVEAAVKQVAHARHSKKPFLVCIGGEDQSTSEDRRFTGFITDPHRVALYYNAADLMLHGAHADNFPCVILEAMACATPVIGSAVGGITEQITDGNTGFLTPRGDFRTMSQRIVKLIDHPDLCKEMGWGALDSVQRYFSLDRQAQSYLKWFVALHQNIIA